MNILSVIFATGEKERKDVYFFPEFPLFHTSSPAILSRWLYPNVSEKEKGASIARQGRGESLLRRFDTHADEFRRRMEELDIQSGLTVVEDAPHSFLGKQVWFDQMIDVADEFLRDHLK